MTEWSNGPLRGKVSGEFCWVQNLSRIAVYVSKFLPAQSDLFSIRSLVSSFIAVDSL